ncbi:MAG: hypothetical protein CMF62_03550 [Magnetococcales bacterium]|nr:hypothetical protein [Magnetococcales bacterium]|tara:strand:- start:42650 stop:43501 length:852 start_codon:yes stop_codon:yes gene_type:complete
MKFTLVIYPDKEISFLGHTWKYNYTPNIFSIISTPINDKFQNKIKFWWEYVNMACVTKNLSTVSDAQRSLATTIQLYKTPIVINIFLEELNIEINKNITNKNYELNKNSKIITSDGIIRETNLDILQNISSYFDSCDGKKISLSSIEFNILENLITKDNYLSNRILDTLKLFKKIGNEFYGYDYRLVNSLIKYFDNNFRDRTPSEDPYEEEYNILNTKEDKFCSLLIFTFDNFYENFDLVIQQVLIDIGSKFMKHQKFEEYLNNNQVLKLHIYDSSCVISNNL